MRVQVITQKIVLFFLQYRVLQASSLVQVWHHATLVPETTINQTRESPTACLVPFMEQQLSLVPDPSQIVQVSQITCAGQNEYRAHQKDGQQ